MLVSATLALPSGAGDLTVSVRIETAPRRLAGLGGPVSLE